MKMTEINHNYMEKILDKPVENAESFEQEVNDIHNSTAIYHGESIDFLYAPKLFPQETVDVLDGIAATTYGILGKIIERYTKDHRYRELFPFDKQLEELILSPVGYECPLPITRIDFFFNEDDYSFRFCEFNADGTSAMNEDRELNIAVAQTQAYRDFSVHYELESFELFDSWVDAFMDIYRSSDQVNANPVIAIVDFMESATPNEFLVFQERFQAKGYKTLLVDIRKLVFDGENLLTEDGTVIDAIYRRAVTSEIMRKKDEAGAFIAAVKAGKCCIIGPLKTQVIHNKLIYKIMHMKETAAFLTEEEIQFIQEHVPYTAWLSEGEYDFEEVADNKDSWIIKPDDLYAAQGVYAGIDQDENTWRKLLKEHTDQGYLLQAYCTPFKTKNILFDKNGRPEIGLYNNITGLYVYGGKLAGIYSRAGQQGTISYLSKGRTLPSIKVKCKS